MKPKYNLTYEQIKFLMKMIYYDGYREARNECNNMAYLANSFEEKVDVQGWLNYLKEAD